MFFHAALICLLGFWEFGQDIPQHIFSGCFPMSTCAGSYYTNTLCFDGQSRHSLKPLMYSDVLYLIREGLYISEIFDSDIYMNNFYFFCFVFRTISDIL